MTKPKRMQKSNCRLKRVVKKIGLEEVFPNLDHASEGELQAAVARYLHHGEHHTDMGISENFNLTTLPIVPFTDVMKVMDSSRSPLIEPYFQTLTMHEIVSLSMDSRGVTLDEPPLDSDDFLACRFFFRFVAEAVERGSRVVVMQDEKQALAVLVHVKALRMLNTNPAMVLLQVEYNCTSKTDQHLMESIGILHELLQRHGTTSSIVGTEHQIHFVYQVLQAHERLLEKTVIAEHDKGWNLRQNYIRPSFIVPLSPIRSDSELHILQEISGVVTPASEGISRNAVESEKEVCAVCDKESTLKLCSQCKSIKYCSRECQVADWKSHKERCKAPDPPEHKKSLSGASILINPQRDIGENNFMILLNHRDTPDFSKLKPAKLNRMPDHKEGEIYVIKAQAGAVDCLVYDRERSFTVTVVDPEEQSALRSAIRSVQAHRGLKAYLNAKNEGDRIRVYLEDLPEQHVKW